MLVIDSENWVLYPQPEGLYVCVQIQAPYTPTHTNTLILLKGRGVDTFEVPWFGYGLFIKSPSAGSLVPNVIVLKSGGTLRGGA
jgi:hypothetical protein